MKIIFKILAAPFVVILTLVVAFMQFLFHISGWVFGLVSSILGISESSRYSRGLFLTGSLCL